MILGLIGHKQHGKTTVANYLVREHGFIALSFADGVRALAEAIDPLVDVRQLGSGIAAMRYTEVLSQYGYEQAKALPDVRRLLQRIGTEGCREVFGMHVWVTALAHRLETVLSTATVTPNVVIPDVRFPNEVEFVREMGGHLARVYRPRFDLGIDPHPSEKFVDTMEVDTDIQNDSTVHVLESRTADWLQALMWTSPSRR